PQAATGSSAEGDAGEGRKPPAADAAAGERERTLASEGAATRDESADDEGATGEAVDPSSAAAEDVSDAAPAKKRGRSEADRPTPPPPERLEGAVEAILLAAGEALSA